MITQNDIQRLFGADVYETDGTKIGSTGQVYLDRQSGDPAWVSVKTGLFGTKESLVPLQKATLSEDRIVVPFDKAQIKNAPRVEPDDDLTPAEEEELYRYYGIGNEQYRDDQFTQGEGQSRSGQPGFETGRDNAMWDDPATRGPAGTPSSAESQARLRRYQQARGDEMRAGGTEMPAGGTRPGMQPGTQPGTEPGTWADDPERR